MQQVKEIPVKNGTDIVPETTTHMFSYWLVFFPQKMPKKRNSVKKGNTTSERNQCIDLHRYSSWNYNTHAFLLIVFSTSKKAQKELIKEGNCNKWKKSLYWLTQT